MKILVAGAGYVGSATAIELAAAGHEVTALRRRFPEPLADISCIEADLLDTGELESKLGSVDTLVYAVGPDARSIESYERAYITGLANVAAVTKPRRILLTSSTGIYGHTDASWVDESTAPAPTSDTGKVLEQAEAAAMKLADEVVILRLAGIYGPGRTGFIRRVRDGEAKPPKAARYSNRIHRADCAGALCHLVSHEAPASLYVGVDDEPSEVGATMGWLAERLGVSLPEPQDPARPRPNKRCKNARLKSSGYTFRYPSFREGYTELLADLDAT